MIIHLRDPLLLASTTSLVILVPMQHGEQDMRKTCFKPILKERQAEALSVEIARMLCHSPAFGRRFLCEGHSETFLEAQGGQMSSGAEGCLGELLSTQELPASQNQTAKLYPQQCHLL